MVIHELNESQYFSATNDNSRPDNTRGNDTGRWLCAAKVWRRWLPQPQHNMGSSQWQTIAKSNQQVFSEGM